jgi:aminomuconate-semialdehyde/2-hydroxymuconate-6-semialdehyde dehydrogenase
MHILNFIDGQLIEPIDKNYVDNINPATNKVYGKIPLSTAQDVQLAVDAASKAFVTWSTTPIEKRFSILNAIADLIDAQLDELALAETIDNGKPLWLSKRMDIPRATANFRFFATGIMHFASESHHTENGSLNYTLRQPIGVVGCISPWNLPLYLFTWKIAPALAAGNCVIAKPSEVTPATAFLLSKICQQAGLPNGVLNIVHGIGTTCGEAIVQHPTIKAISFTGSTKAGERIASIAAPMFKKLSLELGGKNAAIIFDDADWEKSFAETIRSSFTNQGQICLCTSRILIHKNIYDKFKTAFVALAKQLTVGNPLNDANKQGAIVSKIHFEKILGCIELAKKEGGNILCGGNAIRLVGENSEGFFIQPTVIEGLGPTTTTNQDEIFGPVVTLQSFSTIEEAIVLANATNYGLATTIFTQNIDTANNVASKIQSGIVWINCWLERDLRTPFGGVKNSGIGREGGWEALRFFTETKNICIKY